MTFEKTFPGASRFFRDSTTLLLPPLKTLTMPTMDQFPNLNTARRGKGRPVSKLPNPKGESSSSEFSIQFELFEIEDADCEAHTDTDPSARKEGKRGEAEIENSSEVSET